MVLSVCAIKKWRSRDSKLGGIELLVLDASSGLVGSLVCFINLKKGDTQERKNSIEG